MEEEEGFSFPHEHKSKKKFENWFSIWENILYDVIICESESYIPFNINCSLKLKHEKEDQRNEWMNSSGVWCVDGGRKIPVR